MAAEQGDGAPGLVRRKKGGKKASGQQQTQVKVSSRGKEWSNEAGEEGDEEVAAEVTEQLAEKLETLLERDRPEVSQRIFHDQQIFRLKLGRTCWV